MRTSGDIGMLRNVNSVKAENLVNLVIERLLWRICVRLSEKAKCRCCEPPVTLCGEGEKKVRGWEKRRKCFTRKEIFWQTTSLPLTYYPHKPTKKASYCCCSQPNLISLRDALEKKLRYYLGVFPKWRTPPPFWEPLIQKKFIVYFAF